MKKTFVFLAVASMFASCTKDYCSGGTRMIVDKEFKVNYSVKNDTESQVKLVPYKNNQSSEIFIKPGGAYEYWHMTMSGTLEPGKVALFLCDSLDIHFNKSEWVRVYSGAVDASQTDRMLESLFVPSEDYHKMTLTINDSLKNWLKK